MSPVIGGYGRASPPPVPKLVDTRASRAANEPRHRSIGGYGRASGPTAVLKLRSGTPRRGSAFAARPNLLIYACGRSGAVAAAPSPRSSRKVTHAFALVARSPRLGSECEYTVELVTRPPS